MWIPLILPLVDVLTDHIFAIRNATETSSPAVAAIGVALLLNLAFGPMIYGLIFISYYVKTLNFFIDVIFSC